MDNKNKGFHSPKIIFLLLIFSLTSMLCGWGIFGSFLSKKVQAVSRGWTLDSAANYTYDNTKIEISSGQAQLKATNTPVAWYNTSWGRRKAITVDNTGSSNTLTNYQVKISLTSSNFDFSKAKTDGSDLRFTDSDGTTLLSYWIESYDAVSQTATIWPEISSIPASSTKDIYTYYGNSASSPYDYVKLSVDSTVHNDYGLAYPITYEFSIPGSSSDLKAYKRDNEAGSWTQITEKNSSDFFNGIEAVRFDYAGNKTYVSAAFSATSDEMQLKVTDASGQIVDIGYQGITDYYDNRDATVVATSDDWDGYAANNTSFKNACDAFTSRHIWFTPGITVNGVRKDNWPPVVWSEVQSKIDAGYIEPAVHGYEHLGDAAYAYRYAGTHTGSNNELSVLTDSVASFPVDSAPYLVGWTIDNTTDGSSCVITANTATTVTCSGGLSGGTDNDWDTGDSYAIDRYDEEIGDSRQDIIDNLDLPALNKKGSQEYVYAWLEPFGYSDATVRAKLKQYKYLADRSTVTGSANAFANWDITNSFSDKVGTSYTYDTGGVDAANAKFDSVVAAGGIYHLWGHPRDTNWLTDWVLQHLDYIKEKTNIWYVGFGQLYLYHYIDSQNKVTVTKTGGEGSDDSIAHPTAYGYFPSASLDSDSWTAEINGGSGAVTVSGGNVTLDPQNNVTNNAAIKSVQSGFTRLKTIIKATASANSYFTLSLGSGALVGVNGATSWWHTTFYNGYVVFFQSDTDVRLWKMVNGSGTVLDTYTTSLDVTNFHEYELIISGSGVSVERDGVEILSSGDATYSSGYALIGSGEYVTGPGDTAVISWASRQFDSPSDPSTSVGSQTTLYDTADPTIQPTATNALPFTALSDFSETATKNGGEIKYQLSNNGGTTWYWYNSGWTTTSSGYTEANTAADINTNISSFPTGSNSFLFKAYLHSDGSQLVRLASVDVTDVPPVAPTIGGGGPLPPSNAYANWLAQQQATPTAPANPTTTSSLPFSREGALIQYPDDYKVYLIEQGQKHWIKDIQTFNSLGLKWENVVKVPHDQVYPDGEVKQIVFQFTQTLRLGSGGSQVKQLQQYLNNNGFILAARGAGSPNNETTYFGSLTGQALLRHQKANGLKQTGILDAGTRGRMNTQ